MFVPVAAGKGSTNPAGFVRPNPGRPRQRLCASGTRGDLPVSSREAFGDRRKNLLVLVGRKLGDVHTAICQAWECRNVSDRHCRVRMVVLRVGRVRTRRHGWHERGHGRRYGWRQGGGGKGGRNGSDHSNAPADPFRGATPPPSRVVLTPHGGEYFSAENEYEIVYMPLQVRIYLYDKTYKPLSARDVHAQMSLQLPMDSVVRHVPFQYIAPSVGSTEQDYVVAAFDFRQLPDTETPITFEFSGLSDRRHPTASFTPRFSSAKIRPYVAQVRLTKSDQDGVMRQQVCPVSGAVLGGKGPVVKLYIADFPLYVAGEDCIAAVREAPEKFLPQSPMPVPVGEFSPDLGCWNLLYRQRRVDLTNRRMDVGSRFRMRSIQLRQDTLKKMCRLG